MKKTLIVIGCTVFTLGLAGCGATNNAANDDNNGQQRVQTTQIRRGTGTEGHALRVADRIERQVEQLEEVDDAHVIISNNKAYVSVKPAGNRNNAGTGNNMDDNGNAIVNDGLDGNARTFTDNGRVNQDNNRDGNDGIIDGKGDAGSRNRQNAGTADGGYSRNIFGTGNANGTDIGNTGRRNGTTGNNAGGRGTAGYNADGNGAGNNYSEVSSALEQRITATVRRADQSVDRVYVSVDNDLYNRMGTYSNDIRNNGDRDGLFEDFTNTVNDFFGR